MLLISSTAFGQAAFEVASIKLAAPVEFGRISINRGVWKEKGQKGRLHYEGISLRDWIAEANRIQLRQVSGPDWLSMQRFDIEAVIPAALNNNQIPEMLAGLLRERFGLQTHDESKEMPVYALVAAKGGPKLKKSEESSGISGKSTKTIEHVSARTTLTNLADYLSERLDRPVVDQTGLDGPYQIELDWIPDNTAAPGADSAGPSIFTAVQEQLGLRLAGTKARVRSLVIDHIEKTPTDN